MTPVTIVALVLALLGAVCGGYAAVRRDVVAAGGGVILVALALILPALLGAAG